MKLFHKIKRLFSNLPLRILSLVIPIPDQVKHHVPYVSQFANPSWAEMVLKSDQPLAKDLQWEDSGATSIKEYERWALVTCGMACTVMALHFFKKGEFKTIPLAKDAARAGVYTLDDSQNISAMLYRPYKKWIKKFNLKATVYKRLSFKSMCYLISKNKLVIASVNPNIRDYNTAPKTQVGGHLVLITGYNKKDKTVTFHNPSGFENNHTQINHTLPLQIFAIYFAGRGIALQNKA